MMTITEPAQEQAIKRVTKAIETIKEGGMVIMVDDEDRENEGDLVFAAEDACAEHINFMAKEARGLICLPLGPSIANKLQLPMMSDHSKSDESMGTAFTVSIEAKHGVSTGISAKDRAHTCLVAIDDNASPEDIVVPGHIFPLKAKRGGVLERAGHTEGSVDLAVLAGKKPAGVICEIMNDDGTMARRDDLEVFSNKHGIPIVSIEDLITYRLLHDSLVEIVEKKTVETTHGEFEGVWFKNRQDNTVHFALIKGGPFEDKVVDVRVHKQRPLVDVFGTPNNGGRSRIEFGLSMLKNADHGVYVYLTNENTPQSVMQDSSEFDLKPVKEAQTDSDNQRPKMDPRLYGVGAQILRQLGVRKMRLNVSSKRSLVGLAGFGLEIVGMNVMEPLSE